MPDLSDERRDGLHAFLQEQGPPNVEATGALLTGWVLVTSWVSPDGERWLAKGFAAELTHWAATGMHHEALYGDWPEDEQ